MKTDNLELKPLQPKDAAQLFLYRDSATTVQMTYMALSHWLLVAPEGLVVS